MQIQINKSLVVLMAIVLLGIGCATDTSQNNGKNISNQIASNQNAADQTTPAEDKTAPPPVCTGVGATDLKDEINRLPAPLKNQFKEVNPQSGTISLSYDPTKNELTFNGYITGNGNNLSALLNGFDKFRGKQCVKVVVFKGETETESFEWRSGAGSPAPNNCKRDVEDIVNNSRLASQINKSFTFNFDEATKVLTFRGYFGDNPGNGQFTSLIAQLQQLMANGCISKIVFTGETPPKRKTALLNPGFGWNLCQDPLCECDGACISRCPCGSIVNDNNNANIK